jgi:hypothetical protein
LQFTDQSLPGLSPFATVKFGLPAYHMKRIRFLYNNKGQQMRDVGDSRIVMMNGHLKGACRIAIRPVAKGLGLTAIAGLEQLP